MTQGSVTRGPRRLKDDPDFKWETGCDLSDEEHAIGQYDLGATRARLLAAVALAAPSVGDSPASAASTVGDGIPAIRPGPSRAGVPSSSFSALFKPFAAAMTGALVVAGAYWLGVQVGTGDLSVATPEVSAPAGLERMEYVRPDAGEPLPTEIPHPTLPSAAPPPDTTNDGTADVEPILPPTARIESQTNTANKEAANKGATNKATANKAIGDLQQNMLPEAALPSEVFAAQQAAAMQQGTADAPQTRTQPETASTLGQENEALRLADGALADGAYKEAIARYEDYLARFPNGKARTEAQIGRLQALFGRGDVSATEAAARALQDLPSLAGRRSEILQLRAQSLVLLDRCEEALTVAEEIPTRAAAEVRRACRRSGKESP